MILFEKYKERSMYPINPYAHISTPKFDTATLIFSIRKIITNYNGSCIQIRRSSDSTLLEIGFDINGLVDTAAILTFIGTGTAYVRTIYDQSGSGKYLYQATTTAQPMIASGGVIYRDSSNIPLIKFTGTAIKYFNLYSAGAPSNIPQLANQLQYSISTVINTEQGSTTNTKYLYGASNNGMTNGIGDDIIAFAHSSLSYVFLNRSSTGVAQQVVTQVPYNTKCHLFASTLSNSSESISINGINNLLTGLDIATPTSNNGIIVGNTYSPAAGFQFYGNFYELIIWANNSVIADSERINIERNVNNFYKVH